MSRRAFRPLTLALALLACGNPCRDASAAEDKPAVAIPPGGVQLWNCGYWASVWPGQFSGNNAQGVKPITLHGVRNGTFSGQIIAACDGGPIKGLKATVSDLALEGGGGSIPATGSSAGVKVRYARLATAENSWAHPWMFDALLDDPPEVMDKPTNMGALQWNWNQLNRKTLATLPVWVTVRVPKEAKPGRYLGKLTVQAAGLAPVQIPVSLEVFGWTLPDPRDFTVRNLARVSWEEEAKFYNVPLWSEKHLELAGRTMELMDQINSQQVDIELAENVKHRDNSESMVLWVKQPGGGYQYDFTAVEKIFDLCAKKYGRPRPLRVNLWWFEFSRLYASPPGANQGGTMCNRAGKVTTLDPVTNQKGKLDEPPLGTPENIAFWKPVLDELRKRIEKRGWWDVTAVGDVRYAGSVDALCFDTIYAIWPDAKWAATSHGSVWNMTGKDKKTGAKLTMPVDYWETVWGEYSHEPFAKWLASGGPVPKLHQEFLLSNTAKVACSYVRNRHHDGDPIWLYRALPEEMVMRGHRGVGVLGANLWPLKGEKGKFYNVASVDPDSHLGPACSTNALIAPGPVGAVATERYEAFREGVQVAEAMLVLIRGLAGGTLEEGLAKKARDLLNERATWWIQSGGGKSAGGPGGPSALTEAKLAEGAQDRDRRLFEMAAEVAAKLGGK
jgi:hypothetical protein